MHCGKDGCKGADELDVASRHSRSVEGTADSYCLTCNSLQVLLSRPGRGLQMNLGWRHSNGDCVLFLHADSTLPSG